MSVEAHEKFNPNRQTNYVSGTFNMLPEQYTEFLCYSFPAQQSY